MAIALVKLPLLVQMSNNNELLLAHNPVLDEKHGTPIVFFSPNAKRFIMWHKFSSLFINQPVKINPCSSDPAVIDV